MNKRLSVTATVLTLAVVFGNGSAFAQRGGGSGGTSGARQAASSVFAVADERTNSLVITAPEAMLSMIEALIREIDTMSTVTTQFRVFPLQYSDATDMARVFTDLFATQSQSSRFAQSSASSALTRVVAVADERTNSVVVSAPEDAMRTIERIVKEVDTMSEDATELRVFPLRYADAEQTAEMINNVFEETQQRSSSRTDQPRRFGGGPFGMFMGPQGGSQGNQGNQSSGRKVMQETVTAVADTRTNSVVVRAAGEVMVQIAEMVKMLDTDPAKDKKVFVHRLNNATPEDVVAILESLFSTSTSRSGTSANRGTTGRTNQGGGTTTRGGTGGGTQGGGFGGGTQGSGFGGGTQGGGSGGGTQRGGSR